MEQKNNIAQFWGNFWPQGQIRAIFEKKNIMNFTNATKWSGGRYSVAKFEAL